MTKIIFIKLGDCYYYKINRNLSIIKKDCIRCRYCKIDRGLAYLRIYLYYILNFICNLCIWFYNRLI